MAVSQKAENGREKKGTREEEEEEEEGEEVGRGSKREVKEKNFIPQAPFIFSAQCLLYYFFHATYIFV